MIFFKFSKCHHLVWSARRKVESGENSSILHGNMEQFWDGVPPGHFLAQRSILLLYIKSYIHKELYLKLTKLQFFWYQKFPTYSFILIKKSQGCHWA